MIVEIDSSEIIIYLSEKNLKKGFKSKRIPLTKLCDMRRSIESHDLSRRVVLGRASYERFIRNCGVKNVKITSEDIVIRELGTPEMEAVFRQLGPSNANKEMFCKLGY